MGKEEVSAPANSSQVLLTDPSSFWHLQIEVETGADKSSMLATVDLMALYVSQAIIFSGVGLDLLTVNKVSSFSYLLLINLAY